METRFFAHPQAIVDTGDIGAGTRIWAFTHVMSGARIGRDCNVGEQCFIESGAVVGDSVVIKNGVALWSGVEVADSVFIGPNAVFTNDTRPRAKIFRRTVATRICEGASVGANATVRCGIEIGRWAMIGAGAVVTRDVPEYALVLGNPARIRGHVCRCGEKLEFQSKGTAKCECGLRFGVNDGVVFMVELGVLEAQHDEAAVAHHLIGPSMTAAKSEILGAGGKQ